MQKIAVISDIHSNALALEAVLEDLTRRGVSHMVQLGDALYGPVDPLRTAELLMSREMIHIMGNCDEILLNEAAGSQTYHFVKPLLSPAHQAWISGFLPFWISGDILFCHGCPASNERYLLEEVTASGVAIKSPAVLADELSDIQERIVVCGHSHVSRIVYLPGNKLVVNAGSVGLPAYEDELPLPHRMEAGSPHARYVLLEENGGDWTVNIIHLPYDWNEAARLARANGREDYAVAIETGRM